MMESHYADGRILREITELSKLPGRLMEQLADPEVEEIRTRKIEVGEEVEIGGRTLRLTEAGWRRVDRYDARRTHELTPQERRLVT